MSHYSGLGPRADRISQSNPNRTLTTDSAIFSDQHHPDEHPTDSHSSDAADDRDEDSAFTTDSTGNHRDLAATPARPTLIQQSHRPDRHHQRPFSTATLDGINMSNAIHWLANKEIRPLPHKTKPSPLLRSPQLQSNHQPLLQAPELRHPQLPTPASLPTATAAESRSRSPIKVAAGLLSRPTDPVPPSARLPDISGLTSAMGTPARTLNRSRHARVEPGFPQPRKRKGANASHVGAVLQLPNPNSVPVALDLRARVESGDDSDDGSASGESESIHQFPHNQCPEPVSEDHQLSNQSDATASDSHPRLFLDGNLHPRARHAREAEAAAHAFGVEYNGPRPPLSAYAVEHRKQPVDQPAKSREGQAPLVPKPSCSAAAGETTTKLEHMHAELAKIVDRLGKLESVPQAAERRGVLDGDALDKAAKGREPVLSQGAIRDMQAHMRELMRELQRQRKALGAITDLEQDSVAHVALARDEVAKQLALISPPEQVDFVDREEAEHDGELGAEQGQLRGGRRRLPSPSKAVRQKQQQQQLLREPTLMGDAGSVRARPQLSTKETRRQWSGDADALQAQMERVLHHVNLLRDEVEEGCRAPRGDDDDAVIGKPSEIKSRARRADPTALFQAVSEPVSPSLGPAHATVKRLARSSDPPPAGIRARVSAPNLGHSSTSRSGLTAEDEAEEEETRELSEEVENRAASAFAKVRQYARHDRERAPSPPPFVETRANVGGDRGQNRAPHAQYRSALSNSRLSPPNRKVREEEEAAAADLLHDERECTVCRGARKTEKRRASRRDRARAEERNRRRERRQGGGGVGATEEEELLIDVLVEETERHNRANAAAAGLDGTTTTTDPEGVHVLRNVIELTSAQRGVLGRMVKEHMDEFLHQRMLFCELADELKGIHPDMSATRRKILSEHVMEAVETLEVKAERINALQRLLGPDVGGAGGGGGGTTTTTTTTTRGRRGQGSRSPVPARVDPVPELASDYSDGEGQQEENVFLSAAAAAAAAAAQARNGGQRSSPAQLVDADEALDGHEPVRSGSTTSSGKAGHYHHHLHHDSPSRSQPAFSRGRLGRSYSPPTTLAVQELGGGLDEDEDEDEADKYGEAKGGGRRRLGGMSSPIRGGGSPFGSHKYR